MSKDEQVEFMNEYSTKHKFLKVFPDDKFSDITYRRTRDGKVIESLKK